MDFRSVFEILVFIVSARSYVRDGKAFEKIPFSTFHL